MGQWFADSMTGSMLVALPIAVLAGAISFFSPCVVPLLPGYLSYVRSQYRQSSSKIK